MLTPLPERPATVGGGPCHEKIAALALVAAAASGTSQLPFLPSIASTVENTSSNLLARRDSLLEDAPASPMQPQGCHGRTSRNNSYCRRQPCYKGSRYCKLHYQHYVVAGIRTPLEEIETKTTSQDKRYTGAEGEVCCKATTTRGRACAYVAAGRSKYCYLHADYDTNPPPRRGGKGKPESDGVYLRSLEDASLPAEVRITSPPSVSSEDSTRVSSPLTTEKVLKSVRKPKGGSGRRNASKLAEKHADSPYPLLSMISTDQWFGKTVTVATGPCQNQVGTVEKWGNGWVSVQLPTGLHNRRSFELYLHTEDEAGQQGLRKQSDVVDSSLMRCVSSDAPSPAPSDDSVKKAPKTEESLRRFDDALPDHVLDTPRAEKEIATESFKTPMSDEAVPKTSATTAVPKVTPNSPRKTHTELPLVESLVLAQEKRFNMDLLFGTAAIDRGRRSVHSKPACYDDNSSSKRSREEG